MSHVPVSTNNSRLFGLRIESGEKKLPEHKATIKLNDMKDKVFFSLNVSKGPMISVTCSDKY